MSITLELPPELESEIREATHLDERALQRYVIEAVREKTQREREQRLENAERSARLEALQQLTDLSKDLDLDRPR